MSDRDWAALLEERLEALTAPSRSAPAGAPFEPKLLGFVCNWCAYAAADKAGAAQSACPPNLRLVRVMCSGRVDPQMVVKAFDEGADGVLVMACHPGDCHYKEQNLRALHRHRILLRLLGEQGVERERCRLEFVSAAEGERFVQVVTEMVAELRRLGPYRRRGDAVGEEQEMSR